MHDATKEGRSGERFDSLLTAIGKGHLDGFESLGLETDLREIESQYQNRRRQLPHEKNNALRKLQRKALRKFRTYTAKRRELRKQFRSIERDILIAGWLRSNPKADETELRAFLDDPDSIERPDFAQIELDEDQAIEAYLGGSYRSREVRTLVVEPFIRFLKKHSIEPSRKLPLIRMTDALFDWLEIESKDRPTNSGIRTIKRNLKP